MRRKTTNFVFGGDSHFAKSALPQIYSLVSPGAQNLATPNSGAMNEKSGSHFRATSAVDGA